MIRIVEDLDIFGKKYLKYINEHLINEVQVVRCVKTINNFEYMFLVDSNGRIIKNVYKYLNETLANQNSSRRKQVLAALKILYSFLEISNIDINEIGRTELSQLISFIDGGYFYGNNIELNLKTKRTSRTFNVYMGIYRQYLDAFNVDNKVLFEKRTISFDQESYLDTSTVNKSKTEMYVTNKPVTSFYKNQVPKFIKFKEYHDILMMIDNNPNKYKLRDRIIITLMYERGLRIGEVLGITLEDLITHPDNKKAGILIIRNRISDKRHQRAKGVMKVNSHSDYNSNAYNKEDIGYQVVVLPATIMELIKKYIEESRNQFSMTEKAWENIYKLALADSVVDDSHDNYYLFLSKNYSPLSETGWNRILKGIFMDIGILLDKGKREENLNHRFRHGYAMFLVRVMNIPLWELQLELRHRNSSSLKTYYNPTEEMKFEASVKIQEYIRDKLEKLELSEKINKCISEKSGLEGVDEKYYVRC